MKFFVILYSFIFSTYLFAQDTQKDFYKNGQIFFGDNKEMSVFFGNITEPNGSNGLFSKTVGSQEELMNIHNLSILILLNNSSQCYPAPLPDFFVKGLEDRGQKNISVEAFFDYAKHALTNDKVTEHFSISELNRAENVLIAMELFYNKLFSKEWRKDELKMMDWLSRSTLYSDIMKEIDSDLALQTKHIAKTDVESVLQKYTGTFTVGDDLIQKTLSKIMENGIITGIGKIAVFNLSSYLLLNDYQDSKFGPDSELSKYIRSIVSALTDSREFISKIRVSEFGTKLPQIIETSRVLVK